MVYNYFDTHCDTFFGINMNGGSIVDGPLHVTLEKLEPFQRKLQFFALYSRPIMSGLEAYQNIEETYAVFSEAVKNQAEQMAHCKNIEDAKAALEKQKIACFLSIENSSSLQGRVDLLDEFYEKGVRLASLTHSADNIYGCGNDTQDDTGLTELGKQFIKEFEKRGILFDVSHLSFRSFWDGAEVATRPIVASHSCSYHCCKHPRNLTDEQFAEIKRTGGYVGLNLYASFLSEGERCTMDDVLRHLDHFLALGGQDMVGLGCDFDGIDRMPEGMSGVKEVTLLADAMARHHYSDTLIQNILFDNGWNFLQKTL